ncbi:hypothetical protein B7802_09565 [Salmonella enterica]|uniref:Uncharacterized protein n=1 Tax=Salmonella diarizonae TaxID=59204 RepID=A0A6Y2KFB5_SALDZ|nr:hypothetical protein [Salmonella enterica]ECW0266732.1 hypothetical protein [Salmonella enterica subsp. diarizonae]EBD5984301.1 hypothetical protein [Salmonella enterica]EBI4323280.1 hypothetical protein [Salmonella enterica]ECO4387055.1 hypothetical protein [Salmonella enterica]
MKLTIRMPVIWQLNEMTCYGVQPKMLMPTRLIMIFLAVLFSLLTGCASYKNSGWGIYPASTDICPSGTTSTGGCKE